MALPKTKFELEFSHGSIYGKDEEAAVLEVLAASAPSCGAKVQQFEREFAAYCGSRYGLAVSSATAGLSLALIAAGVGPGDEVITTPISWISTANAAAALGAKVVFADVDPTSLNLDPESVTSKITDRTKVILPVHLYGQCCDMNALNTLAKPRGIVVVEDAAHAPGAEYEGRKAGALGDIGVFSFHQQKNMVTLGEGGMVTTNSKALFENMLSHRSLCCRTYDPKGKYLAIDENVLPMGKRYWHLEFDGIGFNYRMTEIQAAVGIVQLHKLDSLNARRIEIAKKYSEGLANYNGLRLPAVPSQMKHVFHIYLLMLEPGFKFSKEDFMWNLYTRKQIKAWSHYMPIHLTSIYRSLGHHEGECPVAESLFDRYVSIPIHPRMTEESIQYVIDSIRDLV
ncbi:MAG TPA: DegT/DnrJ/EryC1/StrS family aminotransferase [Silvibacterium sp.]|jgi:dTDP-4-amino-4,6-dideoxygalactose transaminase|nr:DegT/DnrJ/EryC1/StrS family aminotransferase [Silvibacterium sp.]